MKRLMIGRTVALSALCAAAVLATAFPAGAAECPPEVKNAAKVSITLDFETGKMTVAPDPVTIYLTEGADRPGTVCWVVENLGEKQTLHIEAKEGQPNLFPSTTWMMTKTKDWADSGKPTAAGSWKYQLWITEEGHSGKLFPTDPEIIINGTGGERGGG